MCGRPLRKAGSSSCIWVGLAAAVAVLQLAAGLALEILELEGRARCPRQQQARRQAGQRLDAQDGQTEPDGQQAQADGDLAQHVWNGG
jgi:predicted RecA/RadA family phage recombinase